MPDDPPRPLTTGERALLDALLAHDFPGAAELRAQAPSVRARRGCRCGCGTIGLIPDETSAVSAAVSPVPVEGVIGAVGGVLLFLTEGRLAALEVYSWDGPLPLPPPDQVEWV